MFKLGEKKSRKKKNFSKTTRVDKPGCSGQRQEDKAKGVQRGEM